MFQRVEEKWRNLPIHVSVKNTRTHLVQQMLFYPHDSQIQNLNIVEWWSINKDLEILRRYQILFDTSFTYFMAIMNDRMSVACMLMTCLVWLLHWGWLILRNVYLLRSNHLKQTVMCMSNLYLYFILLFSSNACFHANYNEFELVTSSVDGRRANQIKSILASLVLECPQVNVQWLPHNPGFSLLPGNTKCTMIA